MSSLELRGEKVKLERENYAIDIRCDALLRDFKKTLTLGGISEKIEDLDVEAAASLMADLISLKGEKIRNLGTIKKIEKELS